MNYTTTEQHNRAQRSKTGKQHSYFHSLTCQCPSLLLGGKGLHWLEATSGCTPSNSRELKRNSRFLPGLFGDFGVLFVFSVFGFWLLGGVLLLLLGGSGFKYTDKDKSYKEISYLHQFLDANTGHFCLCHLCS